MDVAGKQDDDKDEDDNEDEEEDEDEEESEPVENTVYYWGNKCPADKCSGCHNQPCQRSFPMGDPLKMKSPDAGCRCLP